MDRQRAHELLDAFADEQMESVVQLLCAAYALAFGHPATEAAPEKAQAAPPAWASAARSQAVELPGEEDVLFYVPGRSQADAERVEIAAPEQAAPAVELPGEEDVLFYVPGQARTTDSLPPGRGAAAEIEWPDEDDVLFCTKAPQPREM